MPLTDSVVTVAQYIENLLITNKATLGLQDVWFGDQAKLPRTPAACVEPGNKTKQLIGAPFRVKNEMTIYILVYQMKIQDAQQNFISVDTIAESIETLLHNNNGLGGLVIAGGFVSSIEPGYANRSGQLLRAARMTYTCQSQTNLPS